MEIDFQGFNIINNSFNNDNNNIINYNGKSDEIWNEEASKEITLTSSDKNKSINEENKNVNIIKKKIYKKNLCIMKPTKSFRYKTFASDEATKKVNHRNLDENIKNDMLNKYSINLNNTLEGPLNSNIEKNKPIKTKKIIKLNESKNFNINDENNSYIKQKPKVSSSGKRITTEKNKL